MNKIITMNQLLFISQYILILKSVRLHKMYKIYVHCKKMYIHLYFGIFVILPFVIGRKLRCAKLFFLGESLVINAYMTQFISNTLQEDIICDIAFLLQSQTSYNCQIIGKMCLSSCPINQLNEDFENNLFQYYTKKGNFSINKVY